MCLAVPGKVLAITTDEADPIGGHVGTVDFQGNRVDVCLAMTPEAQVGDWVLVHAGFAITRLDEAEARETWEYLDAGGLGEIPAELRGSGPAAEPAAGRGGDLG
jgi:hydrogenase expression/formation protein HypC